ncbi:MAG TPA: LacI family DNA-binding transcriptional regulator [Anaerolineaceae bacterium]|nr:LacI family DNA-binding transcriptional regulator [Anaerolineaceae bacterium]
MPDLRLEDIAKKAGVSRSTVSRVVNNQLNVSDKVRQRVLKVIQETGFSPNAAARTLVSQRSNTIGLVLPHSVSTFFTDPYYPHLIKGISLACNHYDFTLALFVAGSREYQEKILPRLSSPGFLDGIIIQSGHQAEQSIIQELVKTRIPVLVAGRPLYEDQICFIDIDNVAASEKAVRHLIQTGYKHIATITGLLSSTVGYDRLTGYKKALESSSLKYNPALIMESDFTESGGYTAMQKLLPFKPDAIFAASDMMAIGAIRAIRDAGLKVPNNVAVVGFDDLPIPAVNEYQLTTINQPVVQFGFKAVETLMELIESNTAVVKQVLLETELIVRKTCGAIK